MLEEFICERNPLTKRKLLLERMRGIGHGVSRVVVRHAGIGEWVAGGLPGLEILDLSSNKMRS
jgi:hypothetical protein